MCSATTNDQSKVSSLTQINYYENLVEKRIEDTFKLLDSNNDGEISPEEIGIENLSPSSLIFLKPIFL